MAEPRRQDEPAKGPRRQPARPDPWPKDPGRKPGPPETDAERREEPLNIDPDEEPKNPDSVLGTHEDEPHPEPPHPPEDAAWDYREPPEEVAAHQAEDVPPSPRGHRLPEDSRVGPHASDHSAEDDGTTRGAWAAPPTGRSGRRHPVGIVLIAVLLGINGLSALGMLVALLFGGGMMGDGMMGGGPMTGPGMAPLSSGTMTLYMAGAAVVNLVLLYGLWTYRKWGYWAVLVVAVIATVWSLLSAFATIATPGVAGDLIGIAIGLAIIAYLTRPRIKALFE